LVHLERQQLNFSARLFLFEKESVSIIVHIKNFYSDYVFLGEIRVQFHNHLIRLKFNPNYYKKNYTQFRQVYQKC